MPQPNFSLYQARGRSTWLNTGGSTAALTHATGVATLPDAYTICGWAVYRWDLATYQGLFDLATGSGFFGLVTQAASGLNLNLWTNSNNTLLRQQVLNRPFFVAYTTQWNGTDFTFTGYTRWLWERSLVTASFTDPGVGGTAPTIYLGNDNFNEWTDGALWNVRVWNRVLTARELMIESLSSTPAETRNVFAWWPLEGQFNELLRDKSGNNRLLTRAGAGGQLDPFFLPAMVLNRMPRRGTPRGFIATGGSVRAPMPYYRKRFVEVA